MTAGIGAQGGFSLIELMVAMVVALVLLTGIGRIMLDSRRSFDTQTTMAEMQQNARLIRFVLTNTVENAGYRVDIRGERAYALPKGFIHGVNGKTTGGGGKDRENPESDALRIRFQSDGKLVNCLGHRVGDGSDTEIADFRLYVDHENNALECQVQPSGKSYTQPLVSNVETMQIRYGVDTDHDDSVDRYTNDPATWRAVRSVRIQLLLRSSAPVLPTAGTWSFEFADGNRFTNESNPDRYARLPVDLTIALRNLLP